MSIYDGRPFQFFDFQNHCEFMFTITCPMHLASLIWWGGRGFPSCIIDDGIRIRATTATATRLNFTVRPIPSVGRVRKHFRGRAKLLTTLLASVRVRVPSFSPPTFLSTSLPCATAFDTRGLVNAYLTNYVVIIRPFHQVMIWIYFFYRKVVTLGFCAVVICSQTCHKFSESKTSSLFYHCFRLALSTKWLMATDLVASNHNHM